MTISAAMEEDDYLVEAASWARYYEKAYELIKQAQAARVADPPPRGVIDDPRAFSRWVEQCDRVHLARMEGVKGF